MYILGIILLGLMGFSLGLLGGGGSILGVPILTYVLMQQAHPAMALSLVLVGATALVAALMHGQQGNVDWKSGAVFAACGLPLNMGGSWLAVRTQGELLLLMFGGLMLIAGVLMFRPRPEPPAGNLPPNPMTVAANGGAVGFVTGFLTVGGGFLTVPALVLNLKMPMKRAVGTSLMIIVMNCVVGTWGHRQHLSIAWPMMGTSLAAACAGCIAGVRLSQKLAGPQLRKFFAIFIIAVGTWMVAKNVSAIWQ